jgi:hypothetical protein
MLNILAVALILILSMFSPATAGAADAKDEAAIEKTDEKVDDKAEDKARAEVKSDATSSLAAEKIDPKTALAIKIHEKVDIRKRLFKALDILTQFMTPTEKLDFWSRMDKAITKDDINDISIKAMADTYTEAELQAMLDFYSSPAGQSAEGKRAEYEAKVSPQYTKLIDEAVVKTGVFSKPQINRLDRNLITR